MKVDDEVSKSDSSPEDTAEDEEMAYAVDRIVGKKKVRGKTHYKVRWEGYGSGDDTWEPEENLENSMDVVKEYDESIKKKSLAGGRTVRKTSASSTTNGTPNKRKRGGIDSFFSPKAKTANATSANENEGMDIDDDNETGRPRRSSRSKRVSYKVQESADVEDSEEPDEEEKGDVESQEESEVEIEEDEEDDELDEEEEDGDSDMSDFEEKPAKRAKKTTTKKKEKTKKETKKSPKKETKKKSNMVDSYKPKNKPAGFFTPYVDAVGFDPTGNIVEGIVLSQVKKVGSLLLCAMKDKNNPATPLQLQTACSGTDAPSIALSLVQECLDKLFSETNDSAKGHGFTFQHVMSCEIEPFKQAYIGRNFPHTLLFPDITKLTNDDVVDVYGRPTPIPKGNLFVAGTSCKDFSMQKNTRRLDIEDKGQSGETFLAAVEFLEKFQPQFAIFENVVNAPWEKMQEYISGRLKLNTVYAKHKGINAPKKGAAKELMFVVDKEGRYVVDVVPNQVGVAAGAVLEGYMTPNKSKLIPIATAGSSSKSATSLDALAKKFKINMTTDTLVFQKKCRYCTHLVKVDTKMYGLPQTRNRKYLFVWKSDNPEDDLGEYFEEIVKYLESPTIHSIDAFFLPATHDRIRTFREALRSGRGQMVARKRAHEPYFWENIHHKDRLHNKKYRSLNGIEDEARFITNWSRNGRLHLAPSLWHELFTLWNGRIKDLIDCFYTSAARDATPRDALHHSFTWNVSQNVTREPFRTATPGVCGCVTPGGNMLVPYLGRTLLGFEKLLLQGIPFSRLLLGNETEVELSDLAGNAMSLPVVCATILAAICAPTLRAEREAATTKGDDSPRGATPWWKTKPKKSKNKKGSQQHDLSDYALPSRYDIARGAVVPERGDRHDELFVKGKKTARVPQCKALDIAEALLPLLDKADDAYASSVLCTCETSGGLTPSATLCRCTGCGLSLCRKCTDHLRVDYHEMVNDKSLGKKKRVDPTVFERTLRGIVPSCLRLDPDAVDHLVHGAGLGSYGFHLRHVTRGQGRWTLVYGAVEDFGAGRQVAEVRIDVGEIGTLGKRGVCAYLRCFAPSIREDKPQRGKLRDHARLVMTKGGDVRDVCWEIREETTKKTDEQSVAIVGSNEEPSWRAEIGLTDEAYHALKDSNTPRPKKFTCNSRNNHLYYHKQWKSWPGTLTISNDDTDRINGTYHRLSCRHTTVQSALWRRDTAPTLYLYIRPDVYRTELDVAVISTTPQYKDDAEIAELMDWIPENALEKKTHETDMKFIEWENCPEFNMTVAPSLLTISSPKTFDTTISGGDEISSLSHLCRIDGFNESTVMQLVENTRSISTAINDNNKNDNKDIIEIPLLGTGAAGTHTTKKFATIAGPTLLKHAAEGKLPLLTHYDNGDKEKTGGGWEVFSRRLSGLGTCDKIVPTRPTEHWKEVKAAAGKIRYQRYYDPVESQRYYMALLERPKIWSVFIDKEAKSLSIDLNPRIACHRAASALVSNRHVEPENVNVSFRLSELSSMAEPETEEFKVPNSDAYPPTEVHELLHPLYPRQAKALTRMISIENSEITFSEDERSEHTLPGVGWCLIGRARQETPLKGGVLADAIGSGKTVVTIALIVKDRMKAREMRDVSKGVSSATLIAMPPGLIRQWDEERKKFTGSQLKCIRIETTKDLQKHSIKDICNADIILVPVSILEDAKGTKRPYTENLTNLVTRSTSHSKNNIKTIPQAPAYCSQKEAPTIEGTWIPNADSIDPFVGNKGDQIKRDEAAYYTHCYSSAINLLRSRTLTPSTTGVPLEYFTFRRVVIDECHESLCTAKGEGAVKGDFFTERRRRGAREFLGVGRSDVRVRPLRATRGVWGLTGTPLLETEARVTELASLMGGMYVTGAAFHWRKEERESGRDLFLNHQEESRSRDYRRAVHESAQSFVRSACQRNRGKKLDVTVDNDTKTIGMTKADATKVKDKKITSIDELSEEELKKALEISAQSDARGEVLRETIDEILGKEAEAKIVIFADTRHEGHEAAIKALTESGRAFSHIKDDDDVTRQNEIIEGFRHVDVTAEDKKKPRLLLLSFEQAAGHNLQYACHNVILYEPVHSGNDAVADASVEQQAIGRVVRQGQVSESVRVVRLVVRNEDGTPYVDDMVVDRNTDESVLQAATSNFE